MNILVVGGDSVETMKSGRSASGARNIEHWSGRKTRDLVREIPKRTDAVIIVLDRISHALVRKVRSAAARRGVPVYYEKRGRHDAIALWNQMEHP